MNALEILETNLRPEFEFEYIDVVSTVLKAVQYHLDMDFQVCFIGDKFPSTDVTSFFTDYSKLQKPSDCVFIQLRDTVPKSFDRLSLKSIGFDSVISTQCNKDDKAALEKLLEPYRNKKEYGEIVGTLPDVIENLIKEIDKIALEKKRGKDKTLSTIYSEHLKEHADKFKNLHEDYIEKLSNSAELAPPFEDVGLKVPDKIIKKQLPHLHKTGYSGQSHRVFNRLKKLHGDKKSAQTDDKEPSSEE